MKISRLLTAWVLCALGSLFPFQRVTAADQVAAASSPTPATASVRFTKTWSFDDTHQAWRADGTCTCSCADGALLVHSNGGDPITLSPEFTTVVEGQAVVSVRMKSSSSGVGQFFWWGGNRGIQEETSITFPELHDGQWHEYTATLPVKGQLQGIRFDPSTAAGEMAIAWIKLVVTAPATPTIAVTIQGRLLDDHNAPVTEGLIMLRDNPQLNALTGPDGNFLIEGKAWQLPDTICASAAGSAVAELPLTHAGARNISIHLAAQDPTFTQIEMGMTLTALWYQAYQQSRPATASQKQCVAAYATFMHERGDAITGKMLTGKPLAPDELPYEYLLAAHIFTTGSGTLPSQAKGPNPADLYCAAIMQKFYNIAIKALGRERLTPDDIHVLRLACAIWGPSGFDPSSVDFQRRLRSDLPEVNTGNPLPFDVPFIRTTPLLTSPEWTNFTSLSATSYLRLEGLWIFLDCFNKWQLHSGVLTSSSATEWRTHNHQPGVEVTSLRELQDEAKGKVLLINCTNLEDLTHPGFYVRTTEYLRRAYRDQVDVYYASQATSDAYVDIFMDEWSIFGPNPKADPLLGKDNARWECRNFTPFRHARMDKLCMMRLPFVSGEILQDGTRDSSYLDNHLALQHNIILDRDGIVSHPYPRGSWYTLPNQGTNFFSSYDAYCSYERQGGDSYWYSLVHEQILRALIANNGRFTWGAPFVPGTLDRVQLQYPRMFFAKDDVFVVTSVDAAHGIVHAGWVDPGQKARRDGFGSGHPNFDGAPSGDFRLHVEPDTRYVLRTAKGVPAWLPWSGQDEPPGVSYVTGNLDSFHPGDRFFATIRLPKPATPDTSVLAVMSDANVLRAGGGMFAMGDYAGKDLQVLRMINYYMFDSYAGGFTKFMPLYGHVVRKEGDVVTVAINQDEVRQMWGYRFWKEQLAAGQPASSMPSLFMPTIMRWADGSDADRTYRFRIDAATDTFRNGLVASASDLAVGDYVFIDYEMWWETQHLQADIITPERLQACDPLIPAYVPPLVRALKAQGVSGTSDEILAKLQTPTPSLLPGVLGSLAVDDPRTRDDAVNALCLLATGHAIEPGQARSKLEYAIKAYHFPPETSYRYRLQLKPVSAPFLRNWLVLGNFPDAYGAGVYTPYGPEQDGVQMEKSYPADGGPAHWKPYAATGDYVDCRAALTPAPGHRSVFYAACWVKVETAQHVACVIGSQGGIFVMVNRQLVVYDPRNRQEQPGMETVFTDMKAGWNELLVKTEFDPDHGGFYLQLYGMDGSPLTITTSTTAPVP